MMDKATEIFEEQINLLFQELKMALRFDRPSILLAIYESEYVRADAEVALTERLRELGQMTREVFINEENYDLPLYLREQADQAKTVYFVSGVRFGGGQDGRNAYRALNIRREYFIDDHLRVVFWLTKQEAFYLPRHAPDFWAFRHRTVEFMDMPDTDIIRKHTENLIWREWRGDMSQDALAFMEDTAAKIAYRERMLTELEEAPETVAIRAGIWYTLGPLYLAQGEYEKAIAAFQQAIVLNPKNANFYNGLGVVYNDLGLTDEAIAAYQQAIALDPKHSISHNGLGNVYAGLGRADDAIRVYQQAIDLDPNLSWLHNGLGNVYLQLGRIDDAFAALQYAVKLDPKRGESYLNLALVNMKQKRQDRALTNLQKGLALVPQECQRVANHSDFEALHDDPRFQELVKDG